MPSSSTLPGWLFWLYTPITLNTSALEMEAGGVGGRGGEGRGGEGADRRFGRGGGRGVDEGRGSRWRG